MINRQSAIIVSFMLKMMSACLEIISHVIGKCQNEVMMNDRFITKHSVGFGINRVTTSHIGRKAVIQNEQINMQGL